MFFNFFFSLPSIFFLSAQSIFFTNFSTFFINYFILLFATLCTLCFDKHFFVKILILLLNAFLILLNHIFLTSLVLIFYITFYLIFNKQCFDEYKQSQIKNNLIEKTYNHNAKTTSIITELLFLLRAKKSLFFTSIFCSLGTLGIFKYLNVTNPAILNNLSNIRLLLLFCLMTSSFIAIFGPYMMNWFYFYADDYLSKNWTIKTIIESKIDLLKILTLLLYILILPFIIFFKLNLVLNTYFFIMNISITISVALIISITEISKIDTTQSPRLSVEKGSLNSSFLPWICELIPIIIIKIFYPIISLYYILIASIIIFGIFHILNERIIQKFIFLVNKKLSNRSI